MKLTPSPQVRPQLTRKQMFSVGQVTAVPQVEDPLGKVFFFTKLAETEPTESESIFLHSGLNV